MEFFPALLIVGLVVGLVLGAAVGGFVVTSNVEITVSLMTAVIVPPELVFMLLARSPLEILVSRASLAAPKISSPDF